MLARIRASCFLSLREEGFVKKVPLFVTRDSASAVSRCGESSFLLVWVVALDNAHFVISQAGQIERPLSMFPLLCFLPQRAQTYRREGLYSFTQFQHIVVSPKICVPQRQYRLMLLNLIARFNHFWVIPDRQIALRPFPELEISVFHCFLRISRNARLIIPRAVI